MDKRFWPLVDPEDDCGTLQADVYGRSCCGDDATVRHPALVAYRNQLRVQMRPWTV